MSSESKREDATARLLRRGFPYGFLAGYPVLPIQRSILSRPRTSLRHAAYAVSQECEKPTGETRDPRTGEEREPLQYSDAPSSLAQRGSLSSAYSSIQSIRPRTQTLTLGSNQTLTPALTNEIRFNYSRNRAHNFYALDSFGGATPPADSVLYPAGRSAQDSLFSFYADPTPHGIGFLIGEYGTNLTQQLNVTDSLSRIVSTHQLKFGLDYRRLNSKAGLAPYTLQYLFLSLANVLTNTVPLAQVTARNSDVQLVFNNWSLFAQDTWKATRSLTFTYGLRWEYNAAPSSPNGTLPFTVNQVNNLATMTVAPQGTPLWHPQKHDFAPRLGIAWQARPNLVLRAGAGIFYDLGYSNVANSAGAWPCTQQKIVSNTSFPLTPPTLPRRLLSTTPLPVTIFAVVDPESCIAQNL